MHIWVTQHIFKVINSHSPSSSGMVMCFFGTLAAQWVISADTASSSMPLTTALYVPFVLWLLVRTRTLVGMRDHPLDTRPWLKWVGCLKNQSLGRYTVAIATISANKSFLCRVSRIIRTKNNICAQVSIVKMDTSKSEARKQKQVLYTSIP